MADKIKNNLSSSIFSDKFNTGLFNYRCVFKSGFNHNRNDVHTDLLKIVSQIDSTNEVNNNFEADNCTEKIEVPYLQSINKDGIKKIVTPQELLAMKLMVENNENLPYQYELVGTNSHKRIIPNPQLKGYLLIKNPKKHIININQRFPPFYSTYYFSTTEEENNRGN